MSRRDDRHKQENRDHASSEAYLAGIKGPDRSPAEQEQDRRFRLRRLSSIDSARAADEERDRVRRSQLDTDREIQKRLDAYLAEDLNQREERLRLNREDQLRKQNPDRYNW